MKKCLQFLLVLASLLLARATGATAVADADFVKLTALNQQARPNSAPSGTGDSARPLSPSESLRWQNRHGDEVAAAALAFIADHPSDPRRGDAVVIALKVSRPFVTEIKPGYDEAVLARETAKAENCLVRDAAAEAEWMRRQDSLVTSLVASADAPASLVTDALAQICYAVSQKRQLPVEEKIRLLRGYLANLEQRAPDHPRLASAYGILLRLLQRNDPPSYLALLETLRTSRNQALASNVAGMLKVESAKKDAFEMRFVAVDGREIDVAKLRGKVVLIDFWATWCGPCKAELPNVVANYRKYHDKGFEVVGIALENASLAAADTPEQHEAKLAKAKKVLTDFTAQNQMPWPHYFDGKFWKNDLSTKFGIGAIPAMFLLDQDGKVASTNARGPKLEEEVKRLLKL